MVEQPVPLERLLDAVAGSDRLVLLGDVVELLEARPQRAMAVAEPILRELSARLGRESEILLVPGNHDRPLVRAWLRSRGDRLRREDEVPPDATPTLAAVVRALGGTDRVRVRYPGTWLGDRVWATHGHYLDRHLFPVSAYGLVRGGRHQPLPDGGTPPSRYELAHRAHASAAIRWLPRPMAGALEDLGGVLRASTMPKLNQTVLDPRMAPLTSRLLGAQMRRHSLPALMRVVADLGVEAEYVIFGHVHRLGPLPGERPAAWLGPGGTPHLINTGSWLYEPRLLHSQHPPHPYWPGGAVVLEDDAPPRPVGLLDDVAPADLRRQRGAARRLPAGRGRDRPARRGSR